MHQKLEWDPPRGMCMSMTLATTKKRNSTMPIIWTVTLAIFRPMSTSSNPRTLGSPKVGCQGIPITQHFPLKATLQNHTCPFSNGTAYNLRHVQHGITSWTKPRPSSWVYVRILENELSICMISVHMTSYRPTFTKACQVTMVIPLKFCQILRRTKLMLIPNLTKTPAPCYLPSLASRKALHTLVILLMFCLPPRARMQKEQGS